MIAFSLVTFLFTLFVIIWGSLVRASGSGAGCGKNWPLCNNELIPTNIEIETIIELTHRLTSGLSFVLVCILYIVVKRNYAAGSLPRVTARNALIFILIEVFIGALLVLFGWVKDDTSIYRIMIVGFHLVNSFLLIGSLALNYISLANYPELILKTPLFWPSKKTFRFIIILFLFTASLGAITALGDTLFTPTSIDSNFLKYLYDEHFLVRFRIFHPIMAIIFSFVLCIFSLESIEKYHPESQTSRISKLLISLIFAQFLIGVLTIAYLAPLMLQLLHLLFSLLIWITTLILITEREFNEN